MPDLNGQARLADSARSGDRREPVGGDEFLEIAQFALPPQKCSKWARQIRRFNLFRRREYT